jgi:hypothetical protein
MAAFGAVAQPYQAAIGTSDLAAVKDYIVTAELQSRCPPFSSERPVELAAQRWVFPQQSSKDLPAHPVFAEELPRGFLERPALLHQAFRLTEHGNGSFRQGQGAIGFGHGLNPSLLGMVG